MRFAAVASVKYATSANAVQNPLCMVFSAMLYCEKTFAHGSRMFCFLAGFGHTCHDYKTHPHLTRQGSKCHFRVVSFQEQICVHRELLTGVVSVLRLVFVGAVEGAQAEVHQFEHEAVVDDAVRRAQSSVVV